MPMIGMGADISALVAATIAGDSNQITSTAQALLQQGASPAVLLGRIGMIAAHGDADGHAILTLNAASSLSRWLTALPEEGAQSHELALPLLMQALIATAPAVRAGQAAHDTYPEPLFPSELPHGKTVDEIMHTAIYENDATLVERLLFGLYGTGADYRTMQVRIYDGISTTFQRAGHPLILAVRGTQLLDTVEWGDRVPHILHWIAPHLPLQSPEPAWINTVRTFLADHSLASLRTRLAAPKDENALPLLPLIPSTADTTQVCQGVYDALITGGASARSVGSVIALAAAATMQMLSDGNRDAFIRAAHGLLFSAAVRLIFTQMQDPPTLPLLFTSAAFINTLHKELREQSSTTQGTQEEYNASDPNKPASSEQPSHEQPSYGRDKSRPSGGLISSTLLATLSEQLYAQDLSGALVSAHRYLQLGHDKHALFATLALAATQTDAATDQGHTLQIVYAAGEEFLAWPAALASTNNEEFLQIALRAIAFAKRNITHRKLTPLATL